MSKPPPQTVTVLAGVPAVSNALYRRLRFSVGDPAAVIELPAKTGGTESLLIVRDIEMDRARKHARVDHVACPADFAPAGGLSGDRETATAQAVAECLRHAGIERITTDRSLPMIFAHFIEQVGIVVDCDTELGVLERRSKDHQELRWLREAQADTEQLMRAMCETIARATVGADGALLHEGEALTSERARRMIAVHALQLGYAVPYGSIVAGGPGGADCHHAGEGPLRTGEPIIVDIFPRNETTRYWGDCTRTVVHGSPPDEVVRMHAAVIEAKAAATAATRAGVTGQAVHEATARVIKSHGFIMGPATPNESQATMPHGTGHGVGLDVHEPPLLDRGGPALVVGDVLTIEPGLYHTGLGGVRVENMVAVTADGCDDFNTLPEGLDWA